MKLSAAQMNLLRQTSLFYAVPETTIEKIAASDDCEIKQYEKFSLVYGKTEFSRSLGIVLFGNLRVTKGRRTCHDNEYTRPRLDFRCSCAV